MCVVVVERKESGVRTSGHRRVPEARSLSGPVTVVSGPLQV